MQTYHAKFYIPIILLWGSAFLSSMDPALLQSDIRFDPYIERGDLLQIDAGGDIELDDIVIYRIDWTDYVAQVIGLPGQEIMLGLDGRSIIRDGERIALAPAGFRITTNASGILAVEEGQAAVYVQSARRNPVSVVISQDSIRGPVGKVYRYSALGRPEWATIGFYSLIVLTLIVLPYAAFMRQRSPPLFRIVVLVVHTFLTLAVAGALLAASLPGDPMNLGASSPIWWWFPLAVVNGFDIELVLVVGLFLGVQWLWMNNRWRRIRNSRPVK
jgi:hypothetical protein